MFLSGLLTTPFNTITTHHELFIQMPDKGYNSFHGRKYLAFIYFLSLGTILKIDWEMLHVVSAERKETQCLLYMSRPRAWPNGLVV